MKIVRVKTGDDIAYGVAGDDGVILYQGSPFVVWEATETVIPWERVRLLAPVLPTKVVGVGKNYSDHAAEMDGSVPTSPLLFIKPSTSVIGPLVPITLPSSSQEVHHEAELAVVIGKIARRVLAEDASNYILGYTAANDVTARDFQQSDGQWTRSKGFDTFCPLGPALETELDPQEGLEIIARVNGQVRQQGRSTDMVYGVDRLLEFISGIMTLLPGDVILTGTPAGVGKLNPGEIVEVEVEGVGILTNPVQEQLPNSETQDG